MFLKEVDNFADTIQQEYWKQDQSHRRSPDHPVVRALFEPRAAFAASLVQSPESASVLDVGCGDGFFTLPLKQYFGRVVGLDFSATMLEKNPCDIKIQATVEQLPFRDEAFDIVVCSHLLHHLQETNRTIAIAEMARLCKTALIIYEPNRNNPLMFLFGLLKKEERMTLEFSKNYLKELLSVTEIKQCSVNVESWIIPNKAPRMWIPFGNLLDRTCLSGLGFYLKGIAIK
jgi:2-polyprenyl-3-methyl-5-hydroxy-6-metoxy-1,4-benzoquinol methylase